MLNLYCVGVGVGGVGPGLGPGGVGVSHKWGPWNSTVYDIHTAPYVLLAVFVSQEMNQANEATELISAVVELTSYHVRALSRPGGGFGNWTLEAHNGCETDGLSAVTPAKVVASLAALADVQLQSRPYAILPLVADDTMASYSNDRLSHRYLPNKAPSLEINPMLPEALISVLAPHVVLLASTERVVNNSRFVNRIVPV